VWASVAAALVGWIPFAAIAINAANARVLEAVLRLGEWFAEWPYAATWVRSPTWPEMLVYGVGTCAIWWISQRKGLRKGALFACLIYANIAVWWIWIHRPGTTEIAFLDVGQGDAAVCRFSTGHTIVIDGGPATAGYDAGDWVVVPYLRSRGIRRVDAVVVTHSDSDHIGGLSAVARAFDTRAVWYNGSGDTASAFRALESNIRQRGGRLQVAGAGDSVAGLGTAQMTFLSPMRDSAWSSRCSDNDRSLVLRIVEYGDTVLFTGNRRESGAGVQPTPSYGVGCARGCPQGGSSRIPLLHRRYPAGNRPAAVRRYQRRPKHVRPPRTGDAGAAPRDRHHRVSNGSAGDAHLENGTGRREVG